MNKMKLEGFLIDVHTVSEENLSVEVDCSHINWDAYRQLIVDLEDILSSIDERHSVRSWLVKGRSLKARYKRVAAEDRRRRLRLSPFPSKFQNVLTNTRAYIYALVQQNCLVLETVGNRKVYLLPKLMAPAFVELIDRINEEIIGPLRKDIEEFRSGPDYLKIEQCLHKHGLDPNVLRVAYFGIGRFRVEVLPVDFGYNIDEAYAKMDRERAARGLEILKEQIERRQREYMMTAAKDILLRLTAMAEEFDESKNLRYFKGRLEKLMELCASLGMTRVVEEFLRPIREICDEPKDKRGDLLRERFGTASLKEAAENFLQTKFGGRLEGTSINEEDIEEAKRSLFLEEI